MRKSYLDNIRWMAVLVVLLYHVFYMYNAEGILGGLGKITSLNIQYYDLFLYLVYPWIMPILFIVSGISARNALNGKSAGTYFKDRTVKLLVPSTIGLFVFQFIQGYISMSLGDGFASMKEAPLIIRYLFMVLSGIGVLWYLQLLWVLTLLLMLVRKMEKGRLWNLCGRATLPVLILLVLPVWGAAQILNTPVIIVYRFGLYGILFFLGYFMFAHEEVINVLKKWFPLFLALAVALCIGFCFSTFGQNYADAPINRSPLFVSFGWFACLAILGGMARYGDFSNRRTEWLRTRSFGLYVFHYLGISAVALFLGKPGRLPAAAVYVLSLLAGIIGGFLLNAIISRIPFFRWAVLGIRKEKKSNVQG